MSAHTKVASKKPTYHKPPRFTPAEYSILLQAMDSTAWIRPEGYSDFKTAFVKLAQYVSSLP